MNTGLIRVREFAQNSGCTPQNIYGHLKTYAKELEGHTVPGRGRQGVLLDEYAQDFLRSVMYPKEISTDAELQQEKERLRGQLLQLGMKNTELAAKLASVEGERDRALLEVNHYQKALNTSREEQEAQAAELDQARQTAKENEEKAAELQRLLDQETALRAAAEEREKALKGRNLWQRITRKGE